ncbi:protein-L-isoaspartate(D-aspartate) O-methyltransferase [Roseibium sp.]|uniref:protein-L-isoaspartate(D-aspartate) O-methyltransferase n=1 Tax=Roseibium sp. TaxID=1936156 RepID=UPI003B524C86
MLIPNTGTLTMEGFVKERQQMVDRQIRARGVDDVRVLDAMVSVPRHLFVASDDKERAYQDCPLPIGLGQTISQPYVVAYMCEALSLTKTSKVLDVGTGSGYSAAVLSELAGTVIGVERKPDLVDLAKTNLARAGYGAIEVHCADGSMGYLKEAPYDAIMVGAGAPATPDQLQQQLAIGGHLVIPIGPSRHHQMLWRITRISEDEFDTKNLGDVSFVPLIGEDGWEAGFD